MKEFELEQVIFRAAWLGSDIPKLATNGFTLERRRDRRDRCRATLPAIDLTADLK